MEINREKLITLLKMAFDEGWASYKDLRDSAVEKMVSDFENSFPRNESSPKVIWRTDGSTQPTWGTNQPAYCGSYSIGDLRPAASGVHHQSNQDVFDLNSYGNIH